MAGPQGLLRCSPFRRVRLTPALTCNRTSTVSRRRLLAARADTTSTSTNGCQVQRLVRPRNVIAGCSPRLVGTPPVPRTAQEFLARVSDGGVLSPAANRSPVAEKTVGTPPLPRTAQEFLARNPRGGVPSPAADRSPAAE